MKMILIILTLIPTLSQAGPSMTDGVGRNTKAARKGSVIDLGELEIEGEVRRPNVTWIDSQKRLKNMLPVFHRSEFKALEDQLVRPGTVEDLKQKMQQGVSRVNR